MSHSIIFVIASTLGNWLLPTTRPFPLPAYLFPSDSDNSNANSFVSGVPTMFPYPHGNSTVPYAVVVIVSMVVPLLLITFVTVFVARLPFPGANLHKAAKYRLRLRLANTYILGLLLSVALTLFATDLIKNVIGKQRPDFWGRCGGVVPDVKVIEKYTIYNYGMSGTRMVTWEVCQSYYNDVAKPDGDGGVKRVSRGTLQDGWRSFPSGHASVSFAGLGYLSLFLANAFGVLGSRKWLVGRRSILGLVATVIPILVAAYISASRYGDLMHGGIDICAGVVFGVLGMMVGWGWYAVEAWTLIGGRCLDGEETEDRFKLPIEKNKSDEDRPVVVRVDIADEIHAF